MMMSGPDLVSMAEAIRGFRSFMLIRSTVTSTPASFPNSPASRLNSTSEAGTKLTHSRMLSFVPFGKLGAFCAATIAGIPPTAAAPVAAPATLRNARRSNLVTPPGCVAMAHPRRTGPFTTSGPAGDRPAALHILARAPRNGGDHSTTHRSCQALFPHRSRASEARRHGALATMPSIIGRASGSSDDGAPGRSRTCDPRIRSPMLYPAELQARAGILAGYGAAIPFRRHLAIHRILDLTRRDDLANLDGGNLYAPTLRHFVQLRAEHFVDLLALGEDVVEGDVADHRAQGRGRDALDRDVEVLRLEDRGARIEHPREDEEVDIDRGVEIGRAHV